ncbi:MAG: class I SAM-dependent methyltransferase [candidate division WOR-3 bacterium]
MSLSAPAGGAPVSRVAAEQAWQDYWADRAVRDEDFGLISFRRIMLQELQRELQTRPHGLLRLLNAGCGLDPMPAFLLPDYPEIEIYLLDIAPGCLEANHRYLSHRLSPEQVSRLHCQAGSVFELPWPAGHFDVVYHTGLLEHFSAHDQVQILSEICRVLKPGGSYVALHPSSRGRLYLLMKRYWEQSGQWPYGPEQPLGSLKAQVQRAFGQVSVRERNLDFWQTAEMLARHDNQALAWIGSKLRNATRWQVAERLLLWILGGYVLLTSATKE